MLPLIFSNPIFLILWAGSLVIAVTIHEFGWGKPVPFDPFNLANPRRDGALISLAGPISNLLFAFFLALIVRILPYFFSFYALTYILVPIIELNIVLAIFNLIPIHPLDGGKILIGLLPANLANRWDEVLNQYGMLLLVLLLLPLAGGSLASLVISPIISMVMRLLLPFSGGYI
ncbi:MAG: Zn-dependent protease [Microgenomates group bacterium GW2011_GWA2_44_7]|nr:MAG: Zn-dependent protease [Microgenomates group bacterium GW2011_GWA2_44_7]